MAELYEVKMKKALNSLQRAIEDSESNLRASKGHLHFVLDNTYAALYLIEAILEEGVNEDDVQTIDKS